MHSSLRARIQRYVFVFVAVFGLAAMPRAEAQEFEYTGTLTNCGGLCIALGGLFGITTGSQLDGIYDASTGVFCGQVGVGGTSGVLDWDTSLTMGQIGGRCSTTVDFGWQLYVGSAGLTNSPTAITGGFLAIDNFQDAAALASLIVYVSGSGPQDFGIPGGVTADWVAYLPAGGLPDVNSVVASGTGSWSLVTTPMPQISVMPTSVDFMNVLVNGNASMNVTVSNTGAANLTLTAAPALTGTDAAFTIAGASTCTNGLVIAPMASCTTTIGYSPTVAGPTTQNLTIASNDPGGAVMVPISANATEAAISLTSQSLDFMQVQLGQMPTQVITVTNTGNINLLVPGIDAGNTLGGTDFSITDRGCMDNSPIVPSGTCTITVQYAPSGLGVDMDVFIIQSNDTDMPNIDVSLAGEGIPVPAPTISVAPTTLMFPNTVINQTATAMDITVTNNGTANLTVAIGTTNALAAPFTVTNNGCTAAIPGAGGSCVISVGFAPTVVMNFMDTFSLDSNDPATPVVTVNVSGMGVAVPVPNIVVNPQAVMFPTILDTATSTRDVTITNGGDANLVIGTIGGTDPVSAPFSITTNTCSGQTILPAASCMLTITFIPGVVGTFSDSFDIPSNDPDTPSVLATINGAAVATPQAFLTISPTTPVDFGNVIVNNTGGPTTVTLTNEGTADMMFTSIMLTGANSAEFTNTVNCPMTLTPSASCTAIINFMPTSAGPKTASLDIVSDAPNALMAAVALTGMGVVGPQLQLSPASLAFGSSANGIGIGATDNQTLTVTSVGSQPVVVSAAALSGTDAAQFSVDASNCTAAAVATTCNIVVTFAPLTAGDKMAVLTVTSDDTDMPMATVNLTGFVLAGSRIDVMPTAANFGSAAMPIEIAQTAMNTITVSSTGTDSLNITGVSLSGAGAGEFSFTENCAGNAFPRGTSCTVVLTFAPLTAGDKMASLDIANDSANTPNASVALTGFVFMGSRPEVTVTNLSIGNTMNPVDIGSSAMESFNVTSTGTDPLNISALTLSGADAGDFSVAGNCIGAAIPRGNSCSVQLTFTPSSAGDKSAVLTISSDSMVLPTVVVNLTGVVFAGSQAALSVADLSFGTAAPVVVGQSSASDIVVTNTGSTDLIVSALTLAGADAADFAAAGTCLAAAVARNGTCTVTVTFAPGSAGTKAATLDIVSNAANGTVTVALAGTADAAPVVTPPPVSQPPSFTLAEESTGGHCFIATAAYGSYLNEDVQVLRDFRDDVLLRSAPGRAFVKTYYELSPPVASYIGQNDVLRTLVRAVLTPLVYAVKYPLVALALLVMLWAGRRQRRLATAMRMV